MYPNPRCQMATHNCETINKLDAPKQYRLNQWLDTQRDRIDRMRLTAPVLAVEATDSLKFTVTETNIRSAVKVVGIVLPMTSARQANREAEEKQVQFMTNLPRIVEDLQARVKFLEEALASILPPKK